MSDVRRTEVERTNDEKFSGSLSTRLSGQGEKVPERGDAWLPEPLPFLEDSGTEMLRAC